ncbi:MAG: S41 family peptidase [Flavobacteriales bacterium]|jgi:hypothetical protein|nr:S41 family peptidase [Flavobacteriales bacterium]
MKSLLLACLFLIVLQNSSAQSSYISVDKATNDIEQLIKTFDRVHYNPYFHVTPKELIRKKMELLDNWEKDSISFKQFMVTGMKLSAMMSGGHSYMYWQNEKIMPEIKSHYYLPFSGKLIDNNQTFIVTRSKTSAFKAGMQIKTINGISIVELFKECLSYIGGIEAFKLASIEKAFPLFLFFNDTLKAPYSIEIDNSSEIISTKGLDISELSNFLNSAQTQVDYSFEVLDDEIGLISYNSCNNYKKFDQFLKKSFKTIKRENINKLIIDVRENGGGDSGLNDLLLSYITRKPYQQSSGRYWKVSKESKKAYSENKVYSRIFGKDFMLQYMNTPNQEVIEDTDSTELTHPIKPKYFFQGKSCILIGPSTFSSANFLADAVKTYNITKLIGTPTGEYTNDFGEQISFTLPNSHSLVFISSTYDIGANGNASILEPVYPDIYTETDALKYAINWIKNDANNK